MQIDFKSDFSPIGLAVPGKISVIIDGQFGSCGKGLAASYAGMTEHFDIVVTTCSPNAGHSFIDSEGRKRVCRHLPVAGALNKRSTKYLCAGSIIDPDLLLREIEDLEIDPTTVFVSPRAAVIEAEDVVLETTPGSPAERIASTQKGTGAALARKVMREGMLAEHHPKLRPFCRNIDIMHYLDEGLTALIEVPQGFDLGINSGFRYPFVTSRDISVASALSDALVHPSYLGRTLMCVRTYPIRVGHILDGDGSVRGESGPFWEDSREISWDELGVEPERTTVTGRIRRVATFSLRQYENAVRHLLPDFVFLNFANYMKDPSELKSLLDALEPIQPVTHLGFGPAPDQLVSVEFYDANQLARGIDP
jgi:adenylosuccinate synthase